MNEVFDDLDNVNSVNLDDYSNIDENSHIINLWEPLEFNIDENYKYVENGFLFTFFSNLLYFGVAYPILTLLFKLLYNFKIEGKENIKGLSGNFVSVSNHVLFLDCAMVGLALGKRNAYFTTLEGSFKIPFVRKLIKLLKAIPIPNKISNKKHFIDVINCLLHDNCVVHFYPEASLWPYCNKIRHFKNGAFDFAVNNNVPVVPMVFKFVKPSGIRKLFKNKPDIILKILEPVYLKKYFKNDKEKVDFLKDLVFKKMSGECFSDL